MPPYVPVMEKQNGAACHGFIIDGALLYRGVHKGFREYFMLPELGKKVVVSIDIIFFHEDGAVDDDSDKRDGIAFQENVVILGEGTVDKGKAGVDLADLVFCHMIEERMLSQGF